MEKTMKIEEKYKKVNLRLKIDFSIFAVICIAVGMIFLGKNTDVISDYLFDILISWQMALVILGLYSISHKAYLWGSFVAGIGLFFMMPLIIMAEGKEWIRDYWSLILVLVGLLMLINLFLPKHKKCHKNYDFMSKDYKIENGFVFSNNSFSGAKHVVMDEVFKGAEIFNHFGGTILDLRRTNLQQGDTYIDIDSKCGGIEIFLPENWLVLVELNSVLSGVVDDRHYHSGSIDESRRLILRGKISLSGINLKY